MLVQWQYKITERFAREGDEILFGATYSRKKKLKPRPTGLFLYKPTGRRYDYVDYTGRVCGQEVEFCEITVYLEALGYIKFVQKVDCNEDFFR